MKIRHTLLLLFFLAFISTQRPINAAQTKTRRSSIQKMNYDGLIAAIKAGSIDGVKNKLADQRTKEIINDSSAQEYTPLEYAFIFYDTNPQAYRPIIMELFKAGAALPPKSSMYWQYGTINGLLQEEEKVRESSAPGGPVIYKPAPYNPQSQSQQRSQTQPKSRPSVSSEKNQDASDRMFATAVMAFDIESIKKALAAGANPNQKMPSGVPALIDISARNLGDIDATKQLEIVNELLKLSNNYVDEALRTAARAGWNQKLIKPLIDAGAGINSKGSSSKTPLMLVAETLIKNYKDPRLHRESVSEKANKTFAGELITQGANPNELDAVIAQYPKRNARLKALRELYPVS